MDSLEDRTKKLEEWQKKQIEWNESVNEINKMDLDKLDAYDKRLRALEERTSKMDIVYTERIKTLEETVKEFKEWKEWTVYNRFQEIDGNIKSNASRLDKLEEWKQELGHSPSVRLEDMSQEDFERYFLKALKEWNSKKIIDKKVWDEIKHFVTKMDHYFWPEKSLDYGNLRACISRLKYEIKKVDPNWCPNGD